MQRTLVNIGLLVVLFPCLFAMAEAPKPYVQRIGIVADGLHLWYEIKADPEDSSRLIICGTKWDALANTPFGFVYFSGDSGHTWHTALEDRSSVWVTEHSCAVGSHHLAYFVSNAAKQEQIGANPVIGTARLFLSVDSGEHWVEKTRIGWTDYSSSAVSKTSGRLYTFFHAGLLTRDPDGKQGNALGLLVFSPDGTQVAGPYLSSSGVGDSPYTGIYPSDALALPSGSVIALYYASRQGPRGREIEVGTVRADASPEPKLSQIAIGHQQNDSACLNFDNGALTYDPRDNRLFVIYQEGCGSAGRVLLATSNDEGKTWSASVPIAMPKNGSGRVSSPSLIVMSDHTLGLLWEDKPFSPLWFFSYLENNSSVASPIALSEESRSVEISNDSLWTSIAQPGHLGPSANTSPDSVIGIDVQDMVNALWRTDGMAATKDGIIAIWSAGTSEGMQLHSALIRMPTQGFHPNALQTPEFDDVTRDMLLMYGGEQSYAGQYYDETNRTLTFCSALRNRTDHAIKSPIEIRLESLHSNWASVSALNATNSLPGPGAVWDISRLLTGDRISGGAKSNPFCMTFRFGSKPKRPSLRDLDLLSFSLKVLAKHEDPPASSAETYEPHN
jgi:hypothetical protein